MKFGGTSMGTTESIDQVATIVQEKKQMGEKPLVVVSAMSGVTNQLIQLGKDAFNGKKEEVDETLEGLKERHISTYLAFINDQETAENIFLPIINELRDLLKGIGLLKELSKRSEALIDSFGERLSSWLMQAACQSKGMESERFDTRDIIKTDSNYKAARVDFDATKVHFKNDIIPVIQKGITPILTGFIASDENGETTTLGRGGSDYTGAIAAASIGAHELEIWTDVDGVKSGDPRIIKNAQSLTKLSFGEMSEAAAYGAKVVHPKAIIPAVKNNIPVRVLNTFNPEHPGTVIDKEIVEGLKIVTYKDNISTINIHSEEMLGESGFLADIFSVLKEHKISVGLISTGEVDVTMTFDNGVPQSAINDALRKLKGVVGVDGKVEIVPNRAIVCLVGEGIANKAQILGETFAQIPDAELSAVSIGNTGRNVSFVMNNAKVHEVVNTIHSHFFKW